MKSFMSKETINGIYQLVQYVTYPAIKDCNGKVIRPKQTQKRYGFDAQGIPQYIEELTGDQ